MVASISWRKWQTWTPRKVAHAKQRRRSCHMNQFRAQWRGAHFLFHLRYFQKWWALPDCMQRIGLPTGFINGFGSSKHHGPTRYANCMVALALPLIRKLFCVWLQLLWPNLPVDGDAYSINMNLTFYTETKVIRSLRVFFPSQHGSR